MRGVRVVCVIRCGACRGHGVSMCVRHDMVIACGTERVVPAYCAVWMLVVEVA